MKQAKQVLRVVEKQLKNAEVKGWVEDDALQEKLIEVTPEKTRRCKEDDTFILKKHRKWLGRAVQLKFLVKKRGLDKTRRSPDGPALLEKLLTNNEVKNEPMKALEAKIEAKNQLL